MSDIKAQLEELYSGAEISTALISKITDEVDSWRKRPLESVYPIIFFDCLVVKVRHEKHIINKAIYVALGINVDGKKGHRQVKLNKYINEPI